MKSVNGNWHASVQRMILSHTHRFRALWPAIALAAVVVAGVSASTSVVHDQLLRSEPARDDTLHVVPAMLRLTFSRAVTLAAARVRLDGPGGAVDLRPLVLEPDSPAIVLASISGRITAGTHLVAWEILGADGHSVRGDFTFVVASDAAGLAPSVEALTEAAEPAPRVEPVALPTFGSGSPLYVAVRWLWFASLIGVLGTITFRLAVLGRLANADAAIAKVVPVASSLAARIGMGCAAVALAAAVLRLVAQRLAAGVDAGILIGATTWGRGWILHVSAAALALIGFAVARNDRRQGWLIAIPAAIALAFAPALSGHAVSTDPVALSVMADAVHVIGAGGWLGTLLLVVFAGIPVAYRAGEHRDRIVAAIVRAFSPLALVFAGTVALTGVFSAWQHLGSVGALFGSAYGQALLFKLGAITLVIGLGAYNFLRVKPQLPNQAATHRLRRSAALELAMAALVILLTSVLVATPRPSDEPASHAHLTATGTPPILEDDVLDEPVSETSEVR